MILSLPPYISSNLLGKTNTFYECISFPHSFHTQMYSFKVPFVVCCHQMSKRSAHQDYLVYAYVRLAQAKAVSHLGKPDGDGFLDLGWLDVKCRG